MTCCSKLRTNASQPGGPTRGPADNSVSALVDPKVPAYLMSTVNEADAKTAYGALIDFTNVVKAIVNEVSYPYPHLLPGAG